MIVRELKLKPTSKQEATLNEWLNILTGLHNWGIKKLGNDADDKIYYSEFTFKSMVVGSSARLGIPQKTIELAMQNAWRSWQRCFKKLSKRPRLKGRRNPLNSISFRESIRFVGGKLSLGRALGPLRYFKQEIPSGQVKVARIIKRESGWYCQLTLDAEYKLSVNETDASVGIDPGFATLLTLSTGEKVENPRELRKGEERIGQAQRGRNKRLTAILRERQANRRRDRNHKISTDLIKRFATIYYSNDNFKAMAHRFGKSVSEASLGQLIQYLIYKGAATAGRKVIAVNNRNSTKTCSTCGSLTGPDTLAVRSWECACGALHDRDVNAALNTLKVGLGFSLKDSMSQVTETAFAS